MKRGSVVILRRNDGAIAMQLRDDKPDIAYPNHWALPGGGAEGEETPAETAARELFEETKYIAEIEDLRLITESVQVLPDRKVFRSIFFLIYDEIQPLECLEGQRVKFVLQEELPSLKVFADHIEFIQTAEGLLQQNNPERRG